MSSLASKHLASDISCVNHQSFLLGFGIQTQGRGAAFTISFFLVAGGSSQVKRSCHAAYLCGHDGKGRENFNTTNSSSGFMQEHYHVDLNLQCNELMIALSRQNLFTLFFFLSLPHRSPALLKLVPIKYTLSSFKSREILQEFFCPGVIPLLVFQRPFHSFQVIVQMSDTMFFCCKSVATLCIASKDACVDSMLVPVTHLPCVHHGKKVGITVNS